ncbi:ParM/StbA family protein [Bacillus sp. UNCCL81]|uniref:ParM/StbA family protein n=1 Tax=Bacillus sp. UNCCL81 TaxID=1502755 RepID=UPI0008EE5D5C|nr:ParM/StbA family protein [Bacillus sp. UNCCL81]SFC51833.1 plasmid segregation protein ParM [Bacillus sp. UNCCL81]
MKDYMILGIDGGGNEVKIIGPIGYLKFLSAIGEYRERRLKDILGSCDIEFCYKGKKGFAGSLALESSSGGNIRGDSKANTDTLLRVLIGIHLYTDEKYLKIIVGQPITKHIESEKKIIREMLEGEHTITVNRIEKTFTILKCEVAAEGASAFFNIMKPGQIRMIDIGSGTVNLATMKDKKFSDLNSWTIYGGFSEGNEDIEATDPRDLARKIAVNALTKWRKEDDVYIVGGAAEKVIPYLVEYFPNAQLIGPIVNVRGSLVELPPVFANAAGFYEVGKRVYGK